MLDDSVRDWRGVTLADDDHSLFGKAPGSQAQFSHVPLGRVLEHLAEPRFLAGELRKLSVLGFPRFLNPTSRIAYRRSHVYSAFLLNVRRLLCKQSVNFRQDVFVWEDIEFNARAVDVCKCHRFVMLKRQFCTGGCSQHVARSARPYNVRRDGILRVSAVGRSTQDLLVD